MKMIYKTFKFRIKDRAYCKRLEEMADTVNLVWNYCNEISYEEYRKSRKFLSYKNISEKLSDSSQYLNLQAIIIRLVARKHYKRRYITKKSKLNWRSKKRSLSWIPFNRNCFLFCGKYVRAGGVNLKIWDHREIEGEIKTANIVKNSKGNWFVNVVCECPDAIVTSINKSIGIDLGLKNTITCSDGKVYTSPKPLKKYSIKLAKAQRAKKKRQTTNIHKKIQNIRKDFNHKATTEIIKNNDRIFVGNVKPEFLLKKNSIFAKLVTDASWGQIRTMLAYKANWLGKVFQPVNEAWSSCTCSVCHVRNGPSGLSQLDVRNWVCNCCGTTHDRDVNAAINILNFGAGLSSPTLESFN